MPPTVNRQLSTVNCPAALPYHSAASVWLSVDPLSDKYPGVSPYVYCAGNPVVIKDPDGRYGVFVVNQQCDDAGNVIGGTVTLRMTYFYSSGNSSGSLSVGQLNTIKDNINSNLSPFVGQDVIIGGYSYKFDYQIDFIEIPNATDWNLYKRAENERLYDIQIGNYIQAGSLPNGDVGYGSQYHMVIDFDKMEAGIEDGGCDRQTPTHELFHNLGASDTGVYGGTNIMDWNHRIERKNCFGLTHEIIHTRTREVNIRDLENVINRPSYSDRFAIIYE